MELTSTIWEGEDYVPQVWADWLADPHGLLAVAEWGGRAVGLSKLTRLSPTQWWLEGLRVHPEYEGRGVASRLHDYLLGVWERAATGAIRLATASFRKPVQHLSERSGFRKVGDLTPYVAPAVQSPESPAGPDAFRALAPAEVPASMEFIETSRSTPLTYGLMDLGWEWARPEAAFLEAAVQRNQAWWWGKPAGGPACLLVMDVDEDDEGDKAPAARVQLLTGPPERLAACLSDARRLAAARGCPKASWQAPLHPELSPILAAAGFERTWDASIFIYEKEPPGLAAG